MVELKVMSEGVKDLAIQEYGIGVGCIATSVLVFFLREHYKLNRWRGMLEQEESRRQ